MQTLVPARVIDWVTSKVVATEDGHLLTTYPPGRDGYARVGWREGGRVVKQGAHRVAWAGVHGPIPEGMTVHHKCFTPLCVNVDHLGLMENWENARRTGGEDWPLGVCKRNHPNSSMRRYADGYRRCSECARENRKKNRQRKEIGSADSG